MPTATTLPADLAHRMIRAIRADHEAGSIDLTRVTSFSELHDQCDANMYVIDAREAMGLPAVVEDHTDDNAAMDLVNTWLGNPNRHLAPKSS